jgi:hypothetical protein
MKSWLLILVLNSIRADSVVVATESECVRTGNDWLKRVSQYQPHGYLCFETDDKPREVSP